ncbi:MAG: 6-bladed beta-propeller [Balneolaceae bacterium]
MLPVSPVGVEGKVQIRTDRKGNIYLPDHSSVTIRVLNPEGKHLYNIGRQGSGPGEFGRISAIDIYENELVVYDGSNQRIVRFSTMGDPLSVEVPDGEPRLSPVSLHQMSMNQYLFLKKLPANEPSDEKDSIMYSSFFHLFDTNFSHPRSSFASADEVMDTGSAFADMYISTMNTGRVWVGEENDIWFVPGIYEGRLFKYRKNDSNREPVETIEGHLFTDETVQSDDDEEGTIQIVTYSARTETFSGKVLSNSLGIFRMNDEKLFHISSQVYEGARRTFVELFNHQGELEGMGRLEEFTFSEDERGPQIGPFWKDQNDRFYFIDNSGESPVLRIGKIQIKI